MTPEAIVLLLVLSLAAFGWILKWIREEREAQESNEEWKRKTRELELQQLASEGIPSDYLRNPEAAIGKWGKPALDAWLKITEPKYRQPPIIHLTGHGDVSLHCCVIRRSAAIARRMERRPIGRSDGAWRTSRVGIL